LHFQNTAGYAAIMGKALFFAASAAAQIATVPGGRGQYRAVSVTEWGRLEETKEN
jgi:hypothetical protein